MAEVAVKGVGKVYDGSVVAVRGATFTVSDGEFVVLVGPSGCGKSTLLRMIAGLETATEGTISIDGRVVNGVPPRERDIAMVFQNYALYPHMSVFDNMAMSLRIRKTPHEETDLRVREAARLLGIEALLQRRPGQLSGGQRQRVAVGRALVRRPKVFLFDEPLSNLDPDMRVEMRTEINRLHKRLGATMMYVTHDQTEAMTMGDRIVVLREGEIQQIATPVELYNRPANRFVAGFVGSPAMNFWPVRLELGGGTGQAARGGAGAGTGEGAGRGAGSLDHAHRAADEAAAGGAASSAGAALLIAGQQTPVHGSIPQDLAALASRNVELGIRPEDLHMASASPPSDLWVEVQSTVDVVEPLGSETLLYFKLAEVSSVVRTAPTTRLQTGAPLRLRADLRRAHLFDLQTKRTILSWPGS